jgi:uncharacterized protein (TIGR03067 family)
VWKGVSIGGVALLLAFAPAPLPKPEKPSSRLLRALDGQWTVLKWSRVGAVIPPRRRNGIAGEVLEQGDAADGMQAEIRRGRLHFQQPNGSHAGWRLRLPAKATPYGLDLIDPTGARFEAIYKVEGDTLTICYGIQHYCVQDPDRPKAFTNKKQWMLVLKRNAPGPQR